MTIKEFISERLARIIVQIVCVAVTAIFLLATGTQSGIVIILMIAWLVTVSMVEAWDFWKEKTYLDELAAIMGSLDRRYLFAECTPKPRRLIDRKLFELIRLAGKSMVETVSDAQTAGKEYREYVERWVHEVKTPITAAKLICQNADSETRRKLLQELAQIDSNIERALFYARAENPEKDFIIRKTNLLELCNEAIQTHRTLLIQNGIRIEMKGVNETVYTDSKWVAFMLGQLLQNAARYHRREPIVTLSAKRLGNRVQLTVQDNGIGIPAHELPRVFDRGFTGSNGRSRGGSTGMGLYLCKRLADTLEIDLRCVSETNKGTCVILTFPATFNLTKV